MADFQQFYGLDLGDLWRGTLGVHRALVLSEQLKTIPDSRYRAQWRGSEQYQGHGPTEEILQDLFDRITSALYALGGVKASKKDFYPREKAAPAQKKQPATIAEFDPDAFMSDLMG